MWNGLSSAWYQPDFQVFERDAPEGRRLNRRSADGGGPGVTHAAPAARRTRTNGVEAGAEAATRLPVELLVVVEDVLDDAPERSGSENRHDDVRESRSQ